MANQDPPAARAPRGPARQAAPPPPVAPAPVRRGPENIIIETAPCENRVFYHKYLASTPFFTELMMRNLNVAPFTENWEYKHTCTMVYLANYGRARVKGYPYDVVQNMVVTMAELLGPFLPDALFLPQREACDLLIRSVQELLRDETRRRIAPVFDRDAWTALVANNASYVKAESYTDTFGVATNDDYAPNNIEAAIRMLYHLSNIAAGVWKIEPLDLIVGITVSVAKRGTVSAEFINKIIQGISQDLGLNVNIDLDAIQTFYKFFANGINDETIAQVKTRWEGLIPDQALRLTLTVNQLAGSGLTTYATIGAALNKYDTFNWGVISRLFPTEWTNFEAALNAVGNNVYYGFRKDLGVVKSTNFKSLGYVAKELLVRADGRVTLNRYMGWARSIKFKQAVDEMIVNYVGQLAAEQVNIADVAPPEHNLMAQVRDIITGVVDGEQHMFV